MDIWSDSHTLLSTADTTIWQSLSISVPWFTKCTCYYFVSTLIWVQGQGTITRSIEATRLKISWLSFTAWITIRFIQLRWMQNCLNIVPCEESEWLLRLMRFKLVIDHIYLSRQNWFFLMVKFWLYPKRWSCKLLKFSQFQPPSEGIYSSESSDQQLIDWVHCEHECRKCSWRRVFFKSRWKREHTYIVLTKSKLRKSNLHTWVYTFCKRTCKGNASMTLQFVTTIWSNTTYSEYVLLKLTSTRIKLAAT